MNNPTERLLAAAQNLKEAVTSSNAPEAALALPALLLVESELKFALGKIQEIKESAATRTIECVLELVGFGQIDPEALISRLSALAPASRRSGNADIRPPSDQKLTAPYKTFARYRDDKGHVWSGRGPKPAWLKMALARGASLNHFLAVEEGTVSFDASPDVGLVSSGQPAEIFEGFNAGILDSRKS